jgi:hypothetical protein
LNKTWQKEPHAHPLARVQDAKNAKDVCQTTGTKGVDGTGRFMRLMARRRNLGVSASWRAPKRDGQPGGDLATDAQDRGAADARTILWRRALCPEAPAPEPYRDRGEPKPKTENRNRPGWGNHNTAHAGNVQAILSILFIHVRQTRTWRGFKTPRCQGCMQTK